MTESQNKALCVKPGAPLKARHNLTRGYPNVIGIFIRSVRPLSGSQWQEMIIKDVYRRLSIIFSLHYCLNRYSQ